MPALLRLKVLSKQESKKPLDALGGSRRRTGQSHIGYWSQTSITPTNSFSTPAKKQVSYMSSHKIFLVGANIRHKQNIKQWTFSSHRKTQNRKCQLGKLLGKLRTMVDRTIEVSIDYSMAVTPARFYHCDVVALMKTKLHLNGSCSHL